VAGVAALFAWLPGDSLCLQAGRTSKMTIANEAAAIRKRKVPSCSRKVYQKNRPGCKAVLVVNRMSLESIARPDTDKE
jgi:hypothetical protein